MSARNNDTPLFLNELASKFQFVRISHHETIGKVPRRMLAKQIARITIRKEVK